MDKYIIMLVILGSTRLEAYHRLKGKNDVFKKLWLKDLKIWNNVKQQIKSITL